MRRRLEPQALLWARAEPEKLPPRVADALTSQRNTVYVSAVNTWELAIKAGLGRVHLPFADLQATIEQAGFAELAARIAHALRVGDLPPSTATRSTACSSPRPSTSP